MDQEREDYADLGLHPRRSVRLPRWTAALVCGLIGVGFKVYGDWWGGDGLCDLVFVAFMVTGLVVGWHAVRHR
jgi:hypothetical protein